MFIKQVMRSTFLKYRHEVPNINHLSRWKPHSYKNTLGIQKRNINLSNKFGNKSFLETENNFVYDIVTKSAIPDTLFSKNQQISSEEDLTKFLNRDWRLSNATEITKAFNVVKQFCIAHNINVSDPRFDSLVDGLVDHCDKLTDDELLEILTNLSFYPKSPGYAAHNYHDIWSCLDDMCCWRMHTWNIDKILTFADLWFQLNLAKLCDYVFETLDRSVKKADRLTKDQLVHIFFLFNICRKRPVDFEYQAALEHKIREMNVDEMAVVALGHFKSQTRIKIISVQEAMIEEVARKSLGIHEITLTAILKALRYSNPTKLVDKINTMLDRLYPEMDRLSDLCCLHIALLSTGLHTYHADTLRKCSEKIMQNITNVRLKDMERILNVLTMFDFNPNTKPDIFMTVYDEIHRDERIAEINQYPRCLPCTLNYLSLQGIYSYKLMNRVLDMEFISLNYGKHAKLLPRELFSLDACIDIECPDYKGNRLPPTLKYKAAKWLTEYAPSYSQYKKISASDQFFLDTVDTVKKIIGNEELMYIHHVLPHFARADILLCQDQKTGKYVKPLGFERYILGDIMVPFNDGSLKWYAIVVLGWNNTIRQTSLLLGHSLMKERQLKKIGYIPVMVIWNEFIRLSPEEKEEYLRQKLFS